MKVSYFESESKLLSKGTPKPLFFTVSQGEKHERFH